MSRATSKPPRWASQRSESPLPRWRLRLTFVLALLGLAFLSLVYVRQTGDVAATGYDVANLQQEDQDWQRRNEQLRVNIAQLESVQRVATVSSQRLHLGPPQHEIMVQATHVVVPPPPATPTIELASPVAPSVRQLLGLP